MTVNPTAFNPFKDVLASDERLRLKDGVLTVEKSDVRSTQMSGWTRFWTRGQYSQSAILNKMGKLYKNLQNEMAEDEHKDHRNTFIENFKTLEGRATAQNEEFKNVNSIIRFFEAKSFIDVASFHKKFQKVDDKITQAVNDKRQAEANEAQRLQDEADAAEAQIRLQEQRQAQAEAARIARIEQQQADFDAQVKPITDNIELWKNQLETLNNTSVEDYKRDELAKLIANGTPAETAQEAIDYFGDQSYQDEIDNLKLKINMAETTVNAMRGISGL